eukprot:jgi/Chlat1/1401/Chrsp12S01970
MAYYAAKTRPGSPLRHGHSASDGPSLSAKGNHSFDSAVLDSPYTATYTPDLAAAIDTHIPSKSAATHRTVPAWQSSSPYFSEHDDHLVERFKALAHAREHAQAVSHQAQKSVDSRMVEGLRQLAKIRERQLAGLSHGGPYTSSTSLPGLDWPSTSLLQRTVQEENPYSNSTASTMPYASWSSRASADVPPHVKAISYTSQQTSKKPAVSVPSSASSHTVSGPGSRPSSAGNSKQSVSGLAERRNTDAVKRQDALLERQDSQIHRLQEQLEQLHALHEDLRVKVSASHSTSASTAMPQKVSASSDEASDMARSHMRQELAQAKLLLASDGEFHGHQQSPKRSLPRQQKSEVDQLHQQVAELQARMAVVEAQRDQQAQGQRQLQSVLDSKEDLLRDLQVQMQQHESTATELRSELSQRAMQEDPAPLRSQLLSMQQEMVKVEAYYEELIEEMESLRRELVHKSMRLAELEEEVSERSGEADRLRQQQRVTEEQRAALQACAEKEVQRRESDWQEGELQRRSEQLRDADQALELSHNEQLRLRQQLQSCNKRIAESEGCIATAAKHAEPCQLSTSVEAELQLKQAMLQNQNSEIEHLRAKVMLLDSQLEAAEEYKPQLKALEEKLKEAAKYAAGLEETVVSMENKADDTIELQENLEDASATVERLSAQVSELHNALGQRDAQLMDVKEQFADDTLKELQLEHELLQSRLKAALMDAEKGDIVVRTAEAKMEACATELHALSQAVGALLKGEEVNLTALTEASVMHDIVNSPSFPGVGKTASMLRLSASESPSSWLLKARSIGSPLSVPNSVPKSPALLGSMPRFGIMCATDKVGAEVHALRELLVQQVADSVGQNCHIQ